MVAATAIIEVNNGDAALLCGQGLLHSLPNICELLVQQVLEDTFTVSGIEIPHSGYLQLHVLLVVFWGLGIIHMVI